MDNESKSGLEPSSSMDSSTMSTLKGPPTFNHYKFQLVDDKLQPKKAYEINVDTSQMSQDDEKSSLLESLTSYLKDTMICEYNMEEHFIPFDNAPLKCSLLLSKEYQEKDTLMVLLQNKSGSQMGIWSRSACMELSLQDGSMLPWLQKAQEENYGVIIMNPNENSVYDSTTQERKLIPQSGDPTAHVLSVWENYVSTKVCKAKNIFIVANGHGSILAKDIVQKEMILTESVNENRIKAIAMIEASRLIEEDDSVDVQRYMAKKAINFDFSEEHKTGFVLPEEHRPTRQILGVSQNIAVKAEEGTEYYNAIASCKEEIFSYFQLASQLSINNVEDVGYEFALKLAKERNGPLPVEMQLQIDTIAEKEENLGFFARIFGRQNSGKSTKSPTKSSKEQKGSTFNASSSNNSGNVIQMSTHISIEDFDLIKVVGKGAFGKVMLVKKKGDKRDAKPLAMKVLKKAVIEEKRQIENTKSEREILFKIKHPYIVSLRYAFQNDFNLYLVMDYYPGGALFFHLRKQEMFSEARAKFYAAELLLALQHLHDHFIIYRDLKLENILMDEKGHVALTDFGLSKQNVTTPDGASTFCGTAEYIAPELLKGHRYGKAVDWWSFGILVYEMMTGYTPFFHKVRNYMFHMIENVPPQFNETFSTEAVDVLSALLRTNPKERLGASERGAHEIKEMDFFEDIDWVLLEKKELNPPFKVPTIRSANDTRYITPGYKNMEAKDSIAKNSTKEKVNFQGFTYAGDSVLDEEA